MLLYYKIYEAFILSKVKLKRQNPVGPTHYNEAELKGSTSSCLQHTTSDVMFSAFYLKDIRFVDEAHKGQKATIRPSMDGDSTQVHKLVFVSHVVQPLHLVLYLHLALNGGGGGNM